MVIYTFILQWNNFNFFLSEMTRNPGYPKMKQRREKEKVERRRQEFLDADRFKMEEYLRIFNDPETYFTDQERTVSPLYICHAKVVFTFFGA